MFGTVLGVAGGALSAWLGSEASEDAAEAAKREREKQRARQEAWYNKNYYQDYLNTVNAQNALRRVRDEWAKRAQEARARQAVTGGTPEQAAAVAEAGGEAMGNAVANIAAAGEQDKRAIDAQKAAMDANMSAQEIAAAEAREAAGATLMANGIGTMVSSLGGLADVDFGGSKTTVKAAADTPPGMEVPVAAGRATRGIGVEPEVPVVAVPKVYTQEELNNMGRQAHGIYY